MTRPALSLGGAALDRLMPLHLQVGRCGRIRSAGPTLHKFFPGAGPLGRPFLDLFAVQRPRGLTCPEDLAQLTAARLRLALRAPPQTVFKGLAVPLGPGEGWLVNLSLGIGVPEAVRDHRLTDADFAPTDQTVEMLYLLEAKSAVLGELRRLNLRLQSAKSTAEEEALTDTLTGLRNRRGLDRLLQRLEGSGLPFGLMQIDLDFFKRVNDTQGHAAGDAVLATVGRILREELRGGDVAARSGGDEFTVVLPGLDGADRLQAIARRILTRIEEPVPHEGNSCRISASIGTALAPAGADPAQLLAAADRALYAAKRAGRSRIIRVPAEG